MVRNDPVRPSAARWHRPLLLSLLYLGSWLGLDALATVLQPRQESLLWSPATGLTFALLMVLGPRSAPLLLLTGPLHALVLGGPPVDWLQVGVSGVVDTVVYTTVAHVLLRRVRIDPRLPGLRDVFWFLGLAAVVGALLVAVTQAVQDGLPAPSSWRVFVLDTLGHWSGLATGVGTVAPALLVAARRLPALWPGRPELARPVVPATRRHERRHPEDARRRPRLTDLVDRLQDPRLEPAGQAALLVATVYWAYGDPMGGGLDLAYLVYVPVIWIAVRGGFPRVTWAVLVADALAVALVGRDLPEDPLRLQLGLVVLTLVGLELGAMVTGRQHNIAAVQHAAVHDPLTGLANRVLLADRLDAAAHRAQRRPDARFAVLYCDLDGFKAVNDQLGHDVGDELLVAVARRLEQSVRPGDLVSRLGGDEMAVLLDGVSGTEEAVGVAERLVAALGEPLALKGREVVVTASIGVAVADSTGLAGARLPTEAGPARPARSGHADEVLQAADMALQQAKQSGGQRYELFNEPLRRQARDRLGLRAALRRAVGAGAVTVAYQPIVRMADGRLAAVEALARWRDTQRGEVPAAEFIDAAEETGLIHELGMQVLEQACSQAATWRRDFGPAAAPRMAVNVSTRQLLPGDFADRVLTLLDRVGLPAHALELEMTESCAMEPAARGAMQTFTDAGVRLAVDDFGTGYSSFATLREQMPQAFKLDRSFIAPLPEDPPADAIVSAVLALAEHLGATVTAEGVETPEQLHRLRELGCGQVQGFLLGRPVGAEEIERDWLHRPR